MLPHVLVSLSAFTFHLLLSCYCPSSQKGALGGLGNTLLSKHFWLLQVNLALSVVHISQWKSVKILPHQHLYLLTFILSAAHALNSHYTQTLQFFNHFLSCHLNSWKVVYLQDIIWHRVNNVNISSSTWEEDGYCCKEKTTRRTIHCLSGCQLSGH